MDQMTESVRRMIKFLDENIIIHPKEVPLFKKIIEYTEFSFNNEIINIPDEYKKDVNKSLDILSEIYIKQPIPKNMVSFVSDFALLIFNMNNNTMKDINLEKRCELIDKIYNDHLTSVQVFNFLRQIIQKFGYMTNYALPSVDISKHYLASFKDKERNI